MTMPTEITQMPMTDRERITKKEYHWLEYCKWCGRKHYVMVRNCPSCDIYETPQPVSDAVLYKCGADYSCDGCIAYRDHTNPFPG